MINLVSSMVIYQPIQQVFAFMSAPSNDFQWQSGTLAATPISGNQTAGGVYFRSLGSLMGYRNLGTFAVTANEPDKKYSFKSISGPLHSQTSYTFEGVNGSTRITISTQVRAVHLPRVQVDALEQQLKKQIEEDLTMLKNILEAG